MKEKTKQWRIYIAYGAFFSMFINILQLTFPVYMLQIYDRVLSSHSLPTLYVITAAAVVALIVMAMLEFIRSRLLMYCGIKIDKVLSRDVLDELLKKSALYGMPPDQATLRDVSTLRSFFSGNAIQTLFDIPWTPLFLFVIYLLHPLLGMVAIGGAVALIVLAVINERISRKPLEAAGVVSGFLGKFIDTTRRNAQTVRSMGMISGVTSRWQEFNDTVMKLQTQANRKSGLVQSLSSWIRQSMQVFIYGVGAWLTIKGEATAGSMIAASIIMGRALAPIQMGIGSWKSMIEAHGSWKRVKATFSQRKETDDMELPEPKGALAAEQVAFAIGKKMLLRDINFSLHPGESLGLVGPSGAGKSTLCHLLLGVWAASGGAIRLDGADVFKWDQERLGPYIGYLPQDIEFFSGTIAENIARLSGVDSDKVVAAAKHAAVHEMILSFPQGYDTYIGERGLVLSGGQRQRIGLARAVYGTPVLVILDEPNSNLDSEGEQALLASCKYLKDSSATVVIVTHKPALLAGVDKILVLKDGKMVMFGSRKDVFEKMFGVSGGN